MAAAVATKVNGVVMTSSPGPIPAASRARCSGAGARVHRDAVAAAGIAGKLLFKRRDFVAEDELSTLQHR